MNKIGYVIQLILNLNPIDPRSLLNVSYFTLASPRENVNESQTVMNAFKTVGSLIDP
jgi:uncharacterized membrane-anchored protein